MSIFTDVKDLAGGKRKSKEWYRNQMLYGLDPYQGEFSPGDIVFFSYTAATKNLLFWDRFPMVLITASSINTGHFQGGNLHYLRPSMRQSVARGWGGGAFSYPQRCHHKYFMSNANNMHVIKQKDLIDMIPLPVEQFVLRSVGRVIDVPSNFIWSRL